LVLFEGCILSILNYSGFCLEFLASADFLIFAHPPAAMSQAFPVPVDSADRLTTSNDQASNWHSYNKYNVEYPSDYRKIISTIEKKEAVKRVGREQRRVEMAGLLMRVLATAVARGG
jgi:hypothetical protein